MEKYIFVYNDNNVITEYFMGKYANPLTYKGKQYIELEVDTEKIFPVFKAMDRRLDLENSIIVFGRRELFQPETTTITFDEVNWTAPKEGATKEEIEELFNINKEVVNTLLAEIAEEEKRAMAETKYVFIRQGHYDYKTHTVVDYPEVV